MIKPILIYPDARLMKRSRPVQPTDNVEQLLTDMWDTLYDSGGVGLAAIQIGVPLRVFIMDCGTRGTASKWDFINPRIVKTGGYLTPKNEGCLSLPGVVEVVMRWDLAEVEFYDRLGGLHTQVFSELEAQCVQHELEHLDGMTLANHMGQVERERLKSRIIKPNKPGGK
jgi:peptide deformylase